MPTCHVNSLALDNDGSGKVIHLTGRLDSSIPAHSIVVFDSVPGAQEAYWQKPYVARIDAKGGFDVRITEPTRGRGTLPLVFCFENGIVSGDGHGHGIGSALAKPYLATPSGYRLLD